MSIIGEIVNEQHAKDLQKVLIAAIESKNPDVIKFCRDNIYPLYEKYAGEGFYVSLFTTDEYKLIESVFKK